MSPSEQNPPAQPSEIKPTYGWFTPPYIVDSFSAHGDATYLLTKYFRNGSTDATSVPVVPEMLVAEIGTKIHATADGLRSELLRYFMQGDIQFPLAQGQVLAVRAPRKTDPPAYHGHLVLEKIVKPQ